MDVLLAVFDTADDGTGAEKQTVDRVAVDAGATLAAAFDFEYADQGTGYPTSRMTVAPSGRPLAAVGWNKGRA